MSASAPSRKWLISLLFVALTVAVSSAVMASRVDPSRVVLKKLEAAGELSKQTEREIGEAIEQARRVSIVAGVAGGVVGVPLGVLVLALGLRVMAWILGRSLSFSDAIETSAEGALPIGVGSAVWLISALNQRVLSAEMAKTLVPSSAAAWVSVSSDAMQRWLPSLDVFWFASVTLVALGFARSTALRRELSVAMLLSLYLLGTAALHIGVRGLAPMGGGS
ncbi:MAG: YIP1 family protein [Archangium sp.]|nr:YIP1 family protein [Archangium sp.]